MPCTASIRSERLPPTSGLHKPAVLLSTDPQVEIAIGDDKPAIILRHMALLTEADQAILTQFGEHQGFSIYLQPNPPQPITKLFPADGNDFYPIVYHIITFRLDFHPADFTQINTAMNRQMIDLALSLLTLNKDDVVLDLFCGIGNFSSTDGRYATSVTGVELSANGCCTRQNIMLR